MDLSKKEGAAGLRSPSFFGINPYFFHRYVLLSVSL